MLDFTTDLPLHGTSDRRHAQQPRSKASCAADGQAQTCAALIDLCQDKRAPDRQGRTEQSKSDIRLFRLDQLKGQREPQPVEPFPRLKARPNLPKMAPRKNESIVRPKPIPFGVRFQL
jgi:hypothetical protein